MFENCLEIRTHFSDYLDDFCNADERKSLRYHLSFCPACTEHLEQMQAVRQELRALPRRQVSPELALRLRVQLSWAVRKNPFLPLWVWFENALKPLLIPASGGVLASIICFCMFMGARVVPPPDTPDVAVQVFTPARAQELAPMDFSADDNTLVVVAQINAEGRAKGYQVLSGQRSPDLMQRLDRMIYFSIFQPATMFGKPTNGQLILSLRRITVRG